MTLRSFSCSSWGARQGNNRANCSANYFLFPLDTVLQMTDRGLMNLEVLQQVLTLELFHHHFYPKFVSLIVHWMLTMVYTTIFHHLKVYFCLTDLCATANHTYSSWLDVHVADCTVCSVAPCCDKAGFVWHPKEHELLSEACQNAFMWASRLKMLTAVGKQLHFYHQVQQVLVLAGMSFSIKKVRNSTKSLEKTRFSSLWSTYRANFLLKRDSTFIILHRE